MSKYFRKVKANLDRRIRLYEEMCLRDKVHASAFKKPGSMNRKKTGSSLKGLKNGSN